MGKLPSSKAGHSCYTPKYSKNGKVYIEHHVPSKSRYQKRDFIVQLSVSKGILQRSSGEQVFLWTTTTTTPYLRKSIHCWCAILEDVFLTHETIEGDRMDINVKGHRTFPKVRIRLVYSRSKVVRRDIQHPHNNNCCHGSAMVQFDYFFCLHTHIHMSIGRAY